MRRKLAAGNWKMNGTTASLAELSALAAQLGPKLGCDVLICPPATLLAAAASVTKGSVVQIGAQDCHAKPSGAHTGDVSAVMVADAGGRAVILGHSERRTDHGETNAQVRAKAQAAWAAGLTAIICIGETEAERDSGVTLKVLGEQLAGSVPDGATGTNTVVAYEPVWAIGTGRTPTNAQIAEVHDFLRATLTARFGAAAQEMRLLYGGSVKASNAAEIFAIENVDGGLVGGASLKASDFIGIIRAAE